MRKSAEREIVQDVKGKRFYLDSDYDTKLASTAETDKDKTYLLPDRILIIPLRTDFHLAFALNFVGSFFQFFFHALEQVDHRHQVRFILTYHRLGRPCSLFLPGLVPINPLVGLLRHRPFQGHSQVSQRHRL